MANLINYLLVVAAPPAPTSLWPSIYAWLEKFIGNYGWTIFVFTLLVRIIVLPLDFYNRYSTRKNGFIQKRLAGQVNRINEKNKNNKEVANQQVTALYKKEGYNMMGTCIFTIVNLAVTLIIFFSFFNSLKTISSYKMLDQYYTLEQAYDNTSGSTQEKENAVALKYEEINGNSSWLWIKNIWRKDGKTSIIPTYSELAKEVKNGKGYETYLSENVSEEKYNLVMNGLIAKNNDWNGYYITVVLAGVLTFLSQYLSELQNKTKNEPSNANIQTQSTMKVMKFMMPVIMIIFTLTTTASFGIYIIASSLIGIVTSLLIGLIVKKITRKEEEKYLQYIEKEAIQIKRTVNTKPTMVNYKKIGDKL